MFGKKSKKKAPPQAQEISSAEHAIVLLWDGLMEQWKNRDECATRMLEGAAPEVVAAYAKVYGDNVVPIFAAMGRKRRAA